ncbi:MAG: FAD-binding oxidoreductase, partial [Anaerolineae bacterium]|nr:FAD-binding oxidoreductase [Anaerolineae bacterium]
MSQMTADVVICGAGIAGVSTAYELVVKHGLRNVVIVDPLPPLTLTSDKSFEGYRNWWPGPDDAMVSLMNRSIDLLEKLLREAPGRLHMNRSGYLFATADPVKAGQMLTSAQESTRLGAGPLRIYQGESTDPTYIPTTDHEVFDAPSGADIFLDQRLIRKHFPFLTDRAIATVHARRCGWFGAQQFGMYMLEKAREGGAQLVEGTVDEIVLRDGAVHTVKVNTAGGMLTISAPKFIDAAGPMQADVARRLGVELPVFHELHIKVTINDQKRVVPRHMPLLIWQDPMNLPWTMEEREMLAESEDTRWLTEELPSGVHGRPEGSGDSDTLLLQYGYHTPPVDATFPIPLDSDHPEIALRGLATVIPGLSAYLEQMPKPFMDGGYYTRTREN